MNKVHSELGYYSNNYRLAEFIEVMEWVAEGNDGCIIGFPGTGRSTFLRLFSKMSKKYVGELVPRIKDFIFVDIDLNLLPNSSSLIFFKSLIRAVYINVSQNEEENFDFVIESYHKCLHSLDVFYVQTGLLEIIDFFSKKQIKIVFVLNRFDEYCNSISLNSAKRTNDMLRALRDYKKSAVSIIVGVSRELHYVLDVDSVGLLYPLLDLNVYWLKPLNKQDSYQQIKRRLEKSKKDVKEDTLKEIHHLSGGFPSLIVVICQELKSLTINTESFKDSLNLSKKIKFRIAEIWENLTLEEQHALMNLSTANNQTSNGISGKFFDDILDNLVIKGLCIKEGDKWRVSGTLIKSYIDNLPNDLTGRIWLDENKQNFYQDQRVISNLSPMESEILKAFLNNPRKKLSYTQIVEFAWPDDIVREGVSNDAIFQQVRQLRKKLEPKYKKHSYIINWRGNPEGGYIFYPEGKPIADSHS